MIYHSFFLFYKQWSIFVATQGHCLETWKIKVCFLSDYGYIAIGKSILGHHTYIELNESILKIL